MMHLDTLLRSWINEPLPDCRILGLQNDSRKIIKGDAFLAYPGAAVDGRLFIPQAIDAGAVAILYDPHDFVLDGDIKVRVPCVSLPNLAHCLADIASRFYNDPSQALYMTGVTGTNGKTTIAYQLATAHALLHEPAAYIGTLGSGNVEALEPLANTTPDALCLQQLLARDVRAGIKHVCMEVSSHALTQDRVKNVAFKQAIYTNLSHEHLDYHYSMEAYAAAKSALFATSTLAYAIINMDDAYAEKMIERVPSTTKIITYGLHASADVHAVDVKVSMLGSSFNAQTPWGSHTIEINTLGLFNVYNSLAVIASLLAHGYAMVDVARVMKQLQAAPGRMEVVLQKPCVIVDYAHTPDALEHVLSTLVQMNNGSLWVVFGCGGDRDKAKRPMMGRIASQYADHVIITSDNPRTEEPIEIIEEIAEGLLPRTSALKLVDREAAICKALQQAKAGDMVLIAGKGHEAYQQIGDTRFTFSDQRVVREWKK